MSRKRGSNPNPGNLDQKPNKGFLANIVIAVLAAFGKWFNVNQPDGRQIDMKYGVGITRHNVLGVPVVQITGPVNNVTAFLNAKWKDRKRQIMSFGAKCWSATPFVHVIAIDSQRAQTSGLKRTIAKAFATANFLPQFAYYNLVGAIDRGTFVINGNADLATAVNDGQEISQTLAKCVFGSNGCVYGTKTTAIVLYAPDQPRVTFALCDNTAVTLPNLPFDSTTQNVSNNLAGTRAFVAVKRGTDELYFLTAEDIYTLLENPTATKVQWKQQKLGLSDGIEDISLPVVVNGIEAPRLMATMEDGQWSHVAIDVSIDSNGTMTFTANTMNAAEATEETRAVGPIQRADTENGIFVADHDGSPDAIQHRTFRSLPAQLQTAVTGQLDIAKLLEAQQQGRGINTLLDVPEAYQLGATSTARTTRRTAQTTPALS